jgi:hypothetical protein
MVRVGSRPPNARAPHVLCIDGKRRASNFPDPTSEHHSQLPAISLYLTRNDICRSEPICAPKTALPRSQRSFRLFVHPRAEPSSPLRGAFLPLGGSTIDNRKSAIRHGPQHMVCTEHNPTTQNKYFSKRSHCGNRQGPFARNENFQSKPFVSKTPNCFSPRTLCVSAVKSLC